MIRFKCAECGATRDVPGEMAGHKIRCQGCKQPGHVPETDAPLEELPAGAAPAATWPVEARVLVWAMLGLFVITLFSASLLFAYFAAYRPGAIKREKAEQKAQRALFEEYRFADQEVYNANSEIETWERFLRDFPEAPNKHETDERIRSAKERREQYEARRQTALDECQRRFGKRPDAFADLPPTRSGHYD